MDSTNKTAPMTGAFRTTYFLDKEGNFTEVKTPLKIRTSRDRNLSIGEINLEKSMTVPEQTLSLTDIVKRAKNQQLVYDVQGFYENPTSFHDIMEGIERLDKVERAEKLREVKRRMGEANEKRKTILAKAQTDWKADQIQKQKAAADNAQQKSDNVNGSN